MTTPLISVLMPVYNCSPYLAMAVGSILEQTHTDFELICINDGSTDDSGAILDWFARYDHRMLVVHQRNQGIVAALSRSLEVSRAPLLARMDGDDIAFPERFEWQVDALCKDPTIVALGTGALEIDTDDAPLRLTQLTSDHNELVARLLKRESAFFHPSVMMRGNIVRSIGGYRSKYEWIEDHDMWLRLSQHGELSNIQKTGMCYRQHSKSVCWSHQEAQRGRMNELLREAYLERDLEFPEHLAVSPLDRRSPAGHGKWARVAIRGGYIKNAWKHAKRMTSESTRASYRYRMWLELALRSVVSLPMACLHSNTPSVPALKTPWSELMASDGLI